MLNAKLNEDEEEIWIEKAADGAFRFKACAHMAIGFLVVIVILLLLIHDIVEHGGVYWRLGENSIKGLNDLQELILTTVAVGLALAAAVELAYTLWTFEPDEALNPVMLGLAGAIILQLAKLDNFEWYKSIGLMLCVLALGGLFAIRKWIAEFPTESPIQRLRKRKWERKLQEEAVEARVGREAGATSEVRDHSPSSA